MEPPSQENKADAESPSKEATIALRASLRKLIQENGERRDDTRIQETEHASISRQATADAETHDGAGPAQPQQAKVDRTFSADLVLHDDSSGFELWLGSLEDALSLAGLHDRGVNGFVNCALEECVNECMCSRPQRGRARTHARGLSVVDAGFKAENVADSRLCLAPDQVRGLISFDAEWYSEYLGYDTAYLGLAGQDEEGYRMDEHFTEILDFLHVCRQEGRKVLVHCIMGINRSSAALVSFLCAGLGLSLRDAVDMTSKSRGHILSNESFLEQLIGKFGKGSACDDAGHDNKTCQFCISGRSEGQACDVL